MRDILHVCYFHTFVIMSSPTGASSSQSSITPAPSNRVVVSNVGDYTNPLYLHPFDASNTTLISCMLTGCDNYSIWSRAMRFSLFGTNKLKFGEGIVPIPVVPELFEK